MVHAFKMLAVIGRKKSAPNSSATALTFSRRCRNSRAAPCPGIPWRSARECAPPGHSQTNRVFHHSRNRHHVGEDLGEVNEMTAPLELAVVTDPADGALGVVLHLGELGREEARGRSMDTARSAAVEGFMRALPVELMDKGVEAALLGTQGVSGRGNGGSLQRAVHALVPTVLTGASGASSSACTYPDREKCPPRSGDVPEAKCHGGWGINLPNSGYPGDPGRWSLQPGPVRTINKPLILIYR